MRTILSGIRYCLSYQHELINTKELSEAIPKKGSGKCLIDITGDVYVAK
jgi:hypothetical protein